VSKSVALVLSIFFVTACKTTLPSPPDGAERGPISEFIWGKSDIQSEKVSDDVLAEVSPSKINDKYQDAYDDGYNWEYFFTAYRKMSKYFSYEQSATDLMKVYYPKTYKKYRNDEFELASKKAEAVERIKQDTNNFDETRVHKLFTEWDFGKYDFDKGEFPLESLSSTTSYRFKQDHIRMPKNKFPREFKLYLTNPEVIGDLKMAPEKAKVFLQKKKNSRGRIDRELPAMFYFKFVRLDEGEGIFYGEVLGGEVYYGKDDKRVIKSF
tara:strand:- start:836 stop:1636 length:801 start_codon:yes stop_codon:yes gene_type:complete